MSRPEQDIDVGQRQVAVPRRDVHDDFRLVHRDRDVAVAVRGRSGRKLFQDDRSDQCLDPVAGHEGAHASVLIVGTVRKGSLIELPFRCPVSTSGASWIATPAAPRMLRYSSGRPVSVISL